MASLVGLPVELLELICSDLTTGDTLSFCKSCRDLYCAAHPFLFRHITIAWDSTAAPHEPPNLSSLLLFILRNPSYIRYIKTVDVPRVNYDACLEYSLDPPQSRNPSPLSPEDTTLLKDVVGELCLPATDAFKWRLSVAEEANLGAIVALILALCTHLESLTIDVDFLPPGNSWFPDVIRSAVSAPEGATRLSRFHRLTNLTVSSSGSHDLNLSTETFLLCFYLPSVTKLCVDDFLVDPEITPWEPTSAHHQGSAWPFPVPPLAASLTTLQLNNTAARASNIGFLLRHTPNLQSLVYGCTLPSSSSPLCLSDLRQGLSHVRDTLAHLVIRFDIFADEALDPTNLRQVTRGTLGSLGFLTALQDLNISLGVLLGQVTPQSAPPLADVLPLTLKRLTINDDLLNYDAFYTWEGESVGALLMAFFAGAWKSATPQLEKFVLDMRENGYMSEDYWVDKGNQEIFQQLLESHGIKCLVWNGEYL